MGGGKEGGGGGMGKKEEGEMHINEGAEKNKKQSFICKSQS